MLTLLRASALALLCAAHLAQAATGLPQEDLLPGEMHVHTGQAIDKQFAEPLAVGESALLFESDGGELVLWRVFPAQPDRSSTIPLRSVKIESRANTPAQYASVATSAGIWLVGPTIRLIRPDGKLLTGRLGTRRHMARAVGLADGSVMVVGGVNWDSPADTAAALKVDRLWVDSAGALQIASLPSLPGAEVKYSPPNDTYAFGAVHLGAGRVLVTGDKVRPLTLLYEPAMRAWVSLPAMIMTRNAPSLTLLPDGRVWAAGGTRTATTSELWDPARRTWQEGPALPVPMAGHRAAWAHEEGAVLLGAGQFPVVLAWKPGDRQVHIAARTSMQRTGGALLALPGARVGIVSGRGAPDGGAWRGLSPGATVVSLDVSGKAGRIGLLQQAGNAAFAVSKGRLLAFGGAPGRAVEENDEAESTRLAELVDLATGAATTLPAVPFDLIRAQAAWLDGRYAMVHGQVGRSGTVQGLAVLDTVAGSYKVLDAAPMGSHQRVKLLGADAKGAWAAGENAVLYRIDAASGQIGSAPRMQRRREGFVGRVLANGTVVIAGGTVEAEVVASRPVDCPDCQVRYIGWGEQLPSRRHELFNPATLAWTPSAPSRAAGGRAAILPDGRVAKAGAFAGPHAPPESSRMMVELSSANGAAWRTLPWPDGAPPLDGEATVRVLAPLGDSNMPNALFLGLPDGDGIAWWWLPSVDASPLVWRKLGFAARPHVFLPGEIALDPADGADMFALGHGAGVAIYSKPRAR